MNRKSIVASFYSFMLMTMANVTLAANAPKDQSMEEIRAVGFQEWNKKADEITKADPTLFGRILTKEQSKTLIKDIVNLCHKIQVEQKRIKPMYPMYDETFDKIRLTLSSAEKMVDRSRYLMAPWVQINGMVSLLEFPSTVLEPADQKVFQANADKVRDHLMSLAMLNDSLLEIYAGLAAVRGK